MSTNGPALTNTSSTDHQLVKGSIKYKYSAVRGGLPIAAKISPPTTTVSTMASKGENKFIKPED